mmetsp:Transcript_70790/g.207403  ORF Transcript_70790/g.207403 Transcript_70790/m.207403 type:complete len:450 (-) Transcript_70790:388-1737(-)
MPGSEHAAAAAGGVRPSFRVSAGRNLQPAADFAETRPDFRCIDLPAEPVMTEAHDAATTASSERLVCACDTWRHWPSATTSAEPLWNINIPDVLLQLLYPGLPSCTSKLVQAFSLQSGLLLVHPRKLKPMFLTHRPDAVTHALVPMLCGGHQPLDMIMKRDLPMDLRLLVLHLAHSLRVPQYSCVCRVGHSHGLLELFLTVLIEDMSVEIQHCEFLSLQIRRILRRKCASQADILQDDIRLSILSTPDNSSVVIHDVLNPVLGPGRSSGLVIAASEQVLFPLLTDLRLQQPTRRLGLKLIAVVRVLLHEGEHLVQVHMHNDGRQLTDPGQGYPQVVIGEAHAMYACLECGQGVLVVLLGKAADRRHCFLLALDELGGLLKLRDGHHHLPVGLRLPVDAGLVEQRGDDVVVDGGGRGEAAPLHDALGALLEKLGGAAYMPHVVVKLVEGD